MYFCPIFILHFSDWANEFALSAVLAFSCNWCFFLVIFSPLLQKFWIVSVVIQHFSDSTVNLLSTQLSLWPLSETFSIQIVQKITVLKSHFNWLQVLRLIQFSKAILWTGEIFPFDESISLVFSAIDQVCSKSELFCTVIYCYTVQSFGGSSGPPIKTPLFCSALPPSTPQVSRESRPASTFRDRMWRCWPLLVTGQTSTSRAEFWRGGWTFGWCFPSPIFDLKSF